MFLLPVVLGAVLGLTFGLGSPKLYRSDASLGIRSVDSGGVQFGGTPPAAQNQAMLNELLATRSFADDVAASSPLQAYLRTHTSNGWSPTALLKRLLKGPPTLDDRIATALGPKRVRSALPGPDVLEISYEAQDPALAKATLKVLISQFLVWRKQLQGNALTEATKQFTNAKKTLDSAGTELRTYSQQHPSATTQADPELRSLVAAQLQAVKDLRVATSTLNNAAAAASGGAGLPATVKVIAEPTFPVGPTTGKKKVVEKAFAGAFVGALISFLAIMYLSRSGGTESPPATRPAALQQLLAENGEHAVPEHERAAQLLADQMQPRHLSEARRE
jgi:hypothetical protein